MKYFWKFISIVAIPVDFITWNIVKSNKYGYVTYKECINDSKKAYREMCEENGW